MAPKKKGQKMALTEFFADAATGSWADDMDTLPSAPAPRDPSLPKRGELGYLDSMPDRGARAFTGGPPREELPIPSVPPYTAFIGNLTFETEESDLRVHFADLDPTSVRLMKDPAGKPKGFGYIEFISADRLRQAVERSGTQLQGRTIRLSVAEAPSKRDGAFGPSLADEASQWRRSGPLPAREGAAAPTPRRTGSFTPVEGQPERDWGAARGTRFSPSVAPPSPGGLARESSGRGYDRDSGRGYDRESGRGFDRDSGRGFDRDPLTPSVADEASQWRSAKPLAEPRPSTGLEAGRELPPHQGGPTNDPTSPNLADTEATWSRGTKLRAPALEKSPPVESPSEERGDWRPSRSASLAPSVGSRQGSVDGESPRPAPSAPLERRKLQLAPRSVPQTPTAANVKSSGDSKGIFGAAKPIDSAAREREAEEKMAVREQTREEDRKKAREAEEQRRKDEAEAGRLLSEKKARDIKEASDKAMAEAGLAPTLPAAPANGTGGRGGPPGRGGGVRGGNRRPSQQPQRQTSNDPSGARSPSASDPPASGPKSSRPSRPANAPADEDGFETTVTRGPRGRQQDNASPAEKKKDPSIRQGFSFAAAAGLIDNEVGDEAEDVNGEVNGDVNGASQDGSDQAVEETRKEVEEVAV